MRFDEDDGADGDEHEEGTQNPDEKPGGWVGGFGLALGLGLGLGLGGLLCAVRLRHALVHSSQAGCTACTRSGAVLSSSPRYPTSFSLSSRPVNAMNGAGWVQVIRKLL